MTRSALPTALLAFMVTCTAGTKSIDVQATEALAQEESEQKAILVTGASSGLGRAITLRLASEGYFVFAGARKDKDLVELNEIENVESVRLDVTIQEDIDAAVETIRNADRGLYGLVNNAGVAVLQPLIEIEENDFDFQMNVNVYGPYRITKAFSPLILQSKGRITTISSISGIVSGPFFGPYSMSKHAVEAFSDALAGELNRFDVKVSVIEPGGYKSRIIDSMVKRMQESGQSSIDSLFDKELKQTIQTVIDRRESAGDPKDIADAVMHALFDDQPKHRYLVVPGQRAAEETIRTAIEELVQLNYGHAYSFEREELIKMLDESMASYE